MIYLLEDDVNICRLVTYALESQGMEAKGFDRPSLFWRAMAEQVPDLILLDIMLPEEDGLEILQRLKSSHKDLPVLLLTARDTEFDKVRGLDLGADDYIAKPFGMMELLARIRAALRRVEKPAETLTMGKLSLDCVAHSVTVAGEPVSLTLKEYELLRTLLSRPGAVFTRDQLLDGIWGYAFDGESRTVDVHVRTLRQKLGEAGQYIQTVRGVGYKMKEPET